MEPTMQIKNRGEADACEVQRMSPADYSAMKERLIREARIAQAAAIRTTFARSIAAIVARIARLNDPTFLPSPEPKHGD
jgi:hypothetical protein